MEEPEESLDVELAVEYDELLDAESLPDAAEPELDGLLDEESLPDVAEPELAESLAASAAVDPAAVPAELDVVACDDAAESESSWACVAGVLAEELAPCVVLELPGESAGMITNAKTRATTATARQTMAITSGVRDAERCLGCAVCGATMVAAGAGLCSGAGNVASRAGVCAGMGAVVSNCAPGACQVASAS